LHHPIIELSVSLRGWHDEQQPKDLVKNRSVNVDQCVRMLVSGLSAHHRHFTNRFRPAALGPPDGDEGGVLDSRPERSVIGAMVFELSGKTAV
jgi:hypothetical protein